MADEIAPHHIRRRTLIGLGGLSLLAPRLAWAAAPGRRLIFAVSRNGALVGEHVMTFEGDPASPVVTSEVSMTVRLGPVPVYRYRHHAVERWAGGRFVSLQSATSANGKAETVTAGHGEGGLVIESGKGRIVGPDTAAPLTHWNTTAFAAPLFNPQEGKMLKVRVQKAGAGHWMIRGEAEIDDFYDAEGVWSGLRGKLKDGSAMEYRRV